MKPEELAKKLSKLPHANVYAYPDKLVVVNRDKDNAIEMFKLAMTIVDKVDFTTCVYNNRIEYVLKINCNE